MLKKLILAKIFSKVSGHHVVIIQQLDHSIFLKWLERYKTKLSGILNYQYNPETNEITLSSGPLILNIIPYTDSLRQIKTPRVYIDSALPNPYNYKTF
jgi:hypothetical protein